MRKVRSAPQLMALLPHGLSSSRPSSELGERPRTILSPLGQHAPKLPRRRRVKTSAFPFDFLTAQIATQLGDVTQSVESEVVLESETNTVSLEAAYCFAQFGAPDSYDAPDLVNGSEDELTERERELAVCLATPFEGNPIEDMSPLQSNLLASFEEQLISEEIERKRLKVLMNRRRKRILAMLAAMKREELAFLHGSQLFCLEKGIQNRA